MSMSASSAPPDGSLPATEGQRFGRGSGGVTGRGFRPGASGNPTGKSKDSLDVAAIARRHGREALETLLHIMRTGQDKHRVVAAQAVLDRGFGKPKLSVEGDGLQSLTALHLLAARTISEQIVGELSRDTNTRLAPVINGAVSEQSVQWNGQSDDWIKPALE